MTGAERTLCFASSYKEKTDQKNKKLTSLGYRVNPAGVTAGAVHTLGFSSVYTNGNTN
jgi:hypothetical protein